MSEETSSSYGFSAPTVESVRSIAIHAVMYGIAFLFIIPYAWMVSSSLKTAQEALSSNPTWIPNTITFQWYIRLLTETVIVQWLINTIIIALTTTILVLVVDSMIAFAITRLDWPGQRYILGIIVASFMVPGFVNLIPLFTLISDLGLINNYLAVILPFAAGPIGVFLLVQFFKEIPYELQEAAQLDGFSTLRIYLQIIIPLSKSVLTALGLFIFVWSWNQFLWPLIVLQQERAYTLPIGIVTIRDTYTYQPALVMASAMIASMPLFLVFLAVQDKLISAVEMQGVT